MLTVRDLFYFIYFLILHITEMPTRTVHNKRKDKSHPSTRETRLPNKTQAHNLKRQELAAEDAHMFSSTLILQQ